MAKTKVSICIAQDHIPKLGEVIDHLKNNGMDIERVNEAIGVVTGYVEQSLINDLHRLKGVEAVEESRAFQLPPPGSTPQ